jgi:2-succinyl-5-enolpyruvyl-6-hydroxy-3-cyclohexene-1-carboxylate synthase
MTSNPADSHLVIRAMLDELVRCGLGHACTSPGSRNSPIVLGIARETRLRAWSHIDERDSGFFALGLARATGRPALVTCTSGTAAANLLPAVIEAHEAGLPMIVLTADRPPELRDVGAGQAIDQIKLYGGAVKWFCELGVPEASPELMRWSRSVACRAYWTAAGPRPGPVHLNMPLREPLVIDGPVPEEPGAGGRVDGRPWVSQTDGGSPAALEPVRLPARPAGREPSRAVFVAGELGLDPALGARLAGIAARARIPLLADPLSGARRGPAAIAHFDLLLRSPELAQQLRPGVVYRFGELPTSKPLRSWLADLDGVDQVALGQSSRWVDPSASLSARDLEPLSAVLTRLEQDEIAADDTGWLELWSDADRRVAHAISEPLRRAGLSEPAVITALAQFLPPSTTLFVGASMPIRDVEEFFPCLGDPPRVLSNRGANGIDGTVASAFGAAAGSEGEVVLVLGDLTLLHDIGGLLAASRLGLKLTIVLINNDGGGIFNFLAVSGEGEPFEHHIATPTGRDFSHAAALYGCAHVRVSDLDSFAGALMEALSGQSTTIIEVRTDRVANRVLHAEVQEAAVAALGGRDDADLSLR